MEVDNQGKTAFVCLEVMDGEDVSQGVDKLLDVPRIPGFHPHTLITT